MRPLETTPFQEDGREWDDLRSSHSPIWPHGRPVHETERAVFAYRMITRDTVEEKVMELKKKKEKMINSILTDENADISNLTRDDLANLLS